MPLGSILGHKLVVDLLRHAVRRERVPQSLLFAGPDGVGKRTVALALAQAINCPNRKKGAAGQPDDDACGKCPTCLRILRGQHADVTLVDAGGAASIKIEVLRERILNVIGYRPFEGAKRVCIIDTADLLTPQAQDALLKTLEEPPTSAVLILVTAYPDTLAATIQSRCRRVRFGPLAEGDVARVLAERCDIDPGRARVLAAASGGRVSVALAEDAGDLAEDREAALGLLAAAAARGPAVAARLKASAALAQHEAKRRSREAVGTRLALVQSLLRDVSAIVAGAPGDIMNGDLESALSEISRAYDLPRLARAYQAVNDAADWLETRQASPKIVADWVGLAL